MVTIRQRVMFDAPPHAVYGLLMDSRNHSAFTESKAKIGKKVKVTLTREKYNVFYGAVK